MPLLGGGVDLSVELSHADGLGIQDDLLHVLEAVVLAFLLAKGDHSVLKYFVASGLTSASWPNEHDTETYIECFEQLDSLKDERLVSLKLFLINRILDLCEEFTIVWVRDFNRWE